MHRIRPRPDLSCSNPEDQVAVLIPARNEEATIAQCISSVLTQGTWVTEIIVYDDDSSDRTPDIVTHWQKLDPRIKLIRGSNIPDGWYGKSHACHQLAFHARARWMLFLDADALLYPGTVAALVTAAQRYRVSMLSLWPQIQMQTTMEKILMPMLNFYVFTLYPWIASVISRAPRYGLAHGACILFDRNTYSEIGGHTLVRQEIFEDTLLARLWRKRGGYSLCLDGRYCVSVRMYTSFSDIWHGFVKNFYPGFRSEILFWLVVLLHVLLGSILIQAPLRITSHPILLASAGCILLLRVLLALRFRQPVWSALFHLFGEAMLVTVAFMSRLHWRSGHGVQWKGRHYRQNRLVSNA